MKTLSLTLALTGAAAAQTGGRGGLGGLHPQADPPECIGPVERAIVARALAGHRARSGPLPGPADGPALYPFHPQAGNYFGDLLITNFVDLAPGAGVNAFMCRPWSYDGHQGHDTALRSFAEQDIGVPCFAALDGVVVYAHDGEPDRNTVCQGLANGVVIDHGSGRQAWYWHLRRGSVAVSAGQRVRAGQPVGLTASSGCSTGPHLHFETHDNGAVVEPFAGACRAGPSGWAVQPALPAHTYFMDFGVTATHPGSVPGRPQPLPTHNQVLLTDPVTYYWGVGQDLPAGSVYRMRFYRPDGGLSFDSGERPLGFSTQWYKAFWAWWGWDIAQMHTVPGTWRVRIDINGREMVTAPVEVVAGRDPNFNRPPEPITARLDPASPSDADAIFCRLAGSLTVDDPDWDVVRYRYEWFVDGAPYRSLVSAGMADAIPRQRAGASVLCRVTPSDGRAEGAPARAGITVGAACYADCDASAGPGTLDIFDFLCFQNRFGAGDPFACDCDLGTGAGLCDIFDLLCFQNEFGAGCP